MISVSHEVRIGVGVLSWIKLQLIFDSLTLSKASGLGDGIADNVWTNIYESVKHGNS